MRRREFERHYYPKYQASIRAIARKLAQRDDELAQDLEQEGAFALLLLNPDLATSNADAWIRQALKNRMVDYLRKQNPGRYESLDARLEAGDQLEQLPAGDVFLRSTRSPLPDVPEPVETDSED